MNFIHQLKGFELKRKIEPISANSGWMWYVLFEYCNNLGFLEWFTIPNSILMGSSGLSIDKIKSSRNELKQKGYIDYRKGAGNQAGKYHIFDLTVNLTPQFTQQLPPQSTPQIPPQVTHSSPPLYKQTKTKQTDLKNTKKAKSDTDDFFEQIWALYPRKEGKGKITDAQKRKLLDIGLEEMERAIERYKKKLASEQTEIQFVQHGSTFFNSGYVDFLDANYSKPSYKATGLPDSSLDLDEIEDLIRRDKFN